MFAFLTHSFLFEKMSSWLIFRLHLRISSILEFINFILKILFVFLQFIVKNNIFFELVLIIVEKRMLHNIGKSHSFFTINHKNPPEEVLQLSMRLFQFILFAESCYQTEMRICTSSLNLCLHVMTFFYHKGTFEWILCKQHEIEQYSKSPNIDWYSIVGIANDLWSHVFFSSTVSLCTNTTNWPCKPEIGNFVSQFGSFFLKKNVFRFDIPVNEVFLMNKFESFHDLDDDPNSLP